MSHNTSPSHTQTQWVHIQPESAQTVQRLTSATKPQFTPPKSNQLSSVVGVPALGWAWDITGNGSDSNAVADGSL